MSDNIPELVVMTHRGQMVGVSVEGQGPDEAMARSILAAIANLCDIADDRKAWEIYNMLPVPAPGTDRPDECTKIRQYVLRWHLMGVPFGRGQ